MVAEHVIHRTFRNVGEPSIGIALALNVAELIQPGCICSPKGGSGMKPILAALAGFLLSSAIFISGAGVAIYFLMAEPVHKPDASQKVSNFRKGAGTAVAAVGDIRPVSSSNAQDMPGLEDETHARPEETHTASTEPLDAIDEINTSSINTSNDPSTDQASDAYEPLPAEHVAWCSDRYRSYQPETNSYTAYSGESRPCISAYWTSEMIANKSEEQFSTSNESIALSREHVQDCMSRYRSYRPEDNTYQPYGGGPRRQCR